MQLTGGKKPPIGILYDSDFGARIDTILALAMLHGMETKQQARIASITISNPDLSAAQLCEVIEKFYLVQNPTIGLSTFSGPKRDICRVVLEKLAAKPGIRRLTDTAPPELLMRNALSAQYDGNAAMVCCGDSGNLKRLLDLPGAKELVRAKVRTLVVTGTAPAGWPTPVIVASENFGRAVLFPAAEIEEHFAYAAMHPVPIAYGAYGTMPYDAPTTAMSAMLYAAVPEMMAKPEDKEAIASAYLTLASMKPQPRFRRAVVVEENKVAQ